MTTPNTNQTSFAAVVAQNPYLPEGATEVNAIITVTSTGEVVAAGGAQPKIIGFILDTSGSMEGEKIRDGRNALLKVIGLLRPEDYFFVISGASTADDVVSPCQATAANVAKAAQLVKSIKSGGGTQFSTWLDRARALFGSMPNAIKQAVLLTDGDNAGGDPLEEALGKCVGVFQCECRGVGSDFKPAQLRVIADKLLGTVDMIRTPAEIAADFMAILDRIKGLAHKDVSVQVWVPMDPTTGKPAEVIFKQVNPELLDLTAKGTRVNPQTMRFPTGAWGAESRDYHAIIKMAKAGVVNGAKMLAARTAVVFTVDGKETLSGNGMVFAAWTDDADASARMDPKVANYTGQAELVKQMQAGLQARRDGNEAEATKCLTAAHKLAADTGNDATMKLIQKVVDVQTDGTVRLKKHVDAADALEAESRSARTTRLPTKAGA